jgi:cholesterol transport system auxiliary component
MTTRTIRFALLACASSALTLVTGCAGNLLKSDLPAPETFRLAVSAASTTGDVAAATATVPLALAVARPRAATALDTDRIAVLAAGSRFDYYSGARWAEAAPQMLQQNLVGALAAGGMFAAVYAAPARAPVELLLDVELRRFEAVSPGSDASAGPAPVVHVQAQASLVDTRRGVRVTSFVSEAAVPASDNRLGAVVAAFERANAQVVQDISARVQAAAAALPAK